MRIFDNFIPERDIWKERVNCGLRGTIDIIPEIISILTSMLLIVRILTIFSDSLNPDV